VTHRGMGLVGVILLEVDAEGRDVVVFVAVGAGNLRQRRLPQLQGQLHLHGAVVLHPHPRHICAQSQQEHTTNQYREIASARRIRRREEPGRRPHRRLGRAAPRRTAWRRRGARSSAASPWLDSVSSYLCSGLFSPASQLLGELPLSLSLSLFLPSLSFTVSFPARPRQIAAAANRS
jgi:hypothetical protein